MRGWLRDGLIDWRTVAIQRIVGIALGLPLAIGVWALTYNALHWSPLVAFLIILPILVAAFAPWMVRCPYCHTQLRFGDYGATNCRKCIRQIVP
jgi:hypothetical protein